MKKLRKLVPVLVTLSLILAMLTGCAGDTTEPTASVSEPSATGGAAEASPTGSADPEPSADPLKVTLPLTDDTATFSLWTVLFPNMTSYTEDFSESLSFAALEEKTNVHIDVNAVSFFSASENLTMLIASGELYDLTSAMANFYSGGVDSVYENGLIIDVLEYADYMPNYFNWVYSDDSIAKDAINGDGRMPYVYTISDAVYFDRGPVVRTDWLDKIGWGKTDIVTYNDWHTVLTAFKTELGVSSPLWLAYTGGTPTSGLGGGFGISNTESQTSIAPSYMYQIGGVVKFAPYEDGFYDWLELVSTWYDEGLIDPDFISGNNAGAPDNADIGASKYGIWWCSTATMANIFDVNEDEGVGVSAITEPVLNKGDEYHFAAGRDSHISVNGVAVASSCDNIELLCRYLDYHYTDEGSVIASYGKEGISFNYNAGKPEFTDLILNNEELPKNTAISLYTATAGAGVSFLELTLTTFSYDCLPEAIEIWTAQKGECWDFPNAASLTAEENSEYSSIWTDISTFIQEYVLNTITGGSSLENTYDNFIAGLENMDVVRCMEIKQAALDRYNNR